MSYYYSVPKGNQISIGWEDEAKDTVFGASPGQVILPMCRLVAIRMRALKSWKVNSTVSAPLAISTARSSLKVTERFITVCWRILSMATIVRCSLVWATRGEVTTTAA